MPVKVIVPEGVRAVPISLSITVAEHLVGALTGTEKGLQIIVVMVARHVAVMLELPALPE